MPARSFSRTDLATAPGRGLQLLRLAFVAALLSGLFAGAAAADSTTADKTLGERIHARFRVWVQDETIRLKPIEDDSVIRSIELDDDESEAQVNGKAFTADELRAFIGKDGELIAELAALDADGRRAALGLQDPADGDESADDGQEGDEDDGAALPPRAPGAPPPPPPPGGGHFRIESDGDDRVSFGRSIEIRAGESTGEAVCIGCSITVAGEVEGDAVAVGGTVHVESSGTVMGNAVGVGGKVRLEPGATVDGDAVAVGGTVQVAEGATVGGQKSTVGWGGSWKGRRGEDSDDDWPFSFNSEFGELVWSVLRTLFLLLLCCICVLLARGPMERAARRLEDEPWKALFAGLLTLLLFFPVLLFVTVILAVSIIGIPLLVLVPVAILALIVAVLAGFAAVAQSLGRWAAERFGWNLAEPFLPVVVGIAMLQGVTIVARAIGLPGGFFGLFALVLIGFGFCVKFTAWTMGLGAMTLSLLGRDWRRPAGGEPERLSRRAPLEESGSNAIPAPPPPAPVSTEPKTADAEGGELSAESTAIPEAKVEEGPAAADDDGATKA